MSDTPVHLPRVLLEEAPTARALVQGGGAHPALLGEVLFFPFQGGSLLLVRMAGLPADGFYGFHIHEHGTCHDGGDIPFYCAGGHFNPAELEHPHHAGDLPVLLSGGGLAYMIFYTNRFTPREVVGRTVMVHDAPDDYRTPPAGNSGSRIACGPIEALS